MKKKGCLLTLLVAGALFVTALVVALRSAGTVLDRNRERIAQQVSEALGRDVQLGGIGLSLWGALGARVDGLTIADDPEFSAEPFLAAGRVRVAVALLPLLRGQVEVTGLRIEEPVIHVIRTASGFNFDSFGKKRNAAGSCPTCPPQGAGSAAALAAVPVAARGAGARAQAAPLPFRVKLVRITGGEVRFTDRTRSPAASWTVRRIDAAVTDIAPEHAAKLDLSAAVFGEESDLRVRGSAGPPGNRPELDLQATLGPLRLAALRENPFLESRIPPQLEADRPLEFVLRLEGPLDRVAADLRADLTEARLSWAPAFTKPAGSRCGIRARAVRAGERIELDPVEIDLAGLALKAAGTFRPGPPAAVDLKITSNKATLAGWERFFPAMAGWTVAGAASLDARVRGVLGGERLPSVEGTLGLADLSLRLPGAPPIEGFTATIRVTENSAVLPATTFSLGGAAVRVAARAAGLRPLDATAELDAAELPLAAIGAGTDGERLRELALRVAATQRGTASPDVRLTVQSGSGLIRTVPYRALQATVDFRDQVARVEEFSVSIFDGKVSATGRVDLKAPSRPAFDVDTRVARVALGQAFAGRLPAAAAAIRGTLDATVRIAGTGARWAELRQSLSGNGEVAVRDGAIGGVNIAEEVLRGLTRVPGLSALLPESIRTRHPKLFGGEETTFRSLRSEVALREGRVALENLRMSAEDFDLRGKGTVGLDRSVDVGATFVASEALTRDLLQAVREARVLLDRDGRIAVPFRVRGSLPSLRPAVDADFVREALQRALLQKGVEAIFGPSGERKGTPKPERELLRKGLEGLFGR